MSPTARPDEGAQRLVEAFKRHAPRLGVAVFRRSVSAQGPAVPRWRLVDGCGFARRYVSRQAVPLEPPPLDAALLTGDEAQAFARQLFPRAPEVPAVIARLGQNRLLMIAVRDSLAPDDAEALGRLVEPLGAAFDAAERLFLRHYEMHASRMIEDLIRESPMPIILEGPDGKLLFANEAFCDLVGLDGGPSFPAGMTIEELDDHLADVYVEIVETYRRNGEAMWTVRLADGRTVECNVATLMGGRGGKLWYYRDVTARISQEQERDQARRFYERILAALPADLSVFDPDGRYVFVTPSAVADADRRLAMIGKTEAEEAAAGRLPSGVLQQRQERFAFALETRTTQRFEESYPDRFGRMRHFVRFYAPVPNDHGGLLYVIGYGLDVTAQREATEALALSEALKRGIVESSLDGIVSVDDAGRILDFNPAAEHIFGRTAEDVIGKDYAEVLLVDACREGCKARMERFLVDPPKRAEERRLETLGLHASGAAFPVEMSLSMVHVAGLAPTLTATLRDISAEKAAEQERAAHRDALAAANASLERTVEARTHELREALARAEEAGRLKDAILQNVTHEFRTPLAAILGSAAILHEETEGVLQDFTTAITQGGHRLLRLLDAVVELSHLQAGLVETRPQRICLAMHSRAALANVQAAALAKGLAVRYDGPEAPFAFCVDPSLLHRVLHHLLDNAVKFTKCGSVTLRARQTAEGVEMAVEDTGIGMEEAFVERAYVPFEQESSGLARSHEGAGVGLAVAQGLTRLLGASLHIQSRPGEGTTVRFVLPADVGRAEAFAPAPVADAVAASA